MKRPEYVAVVTGIYARAIREGREPTAEEVEQLRTAFSRQGFSDGYFTDHTGRHMFGTRQEEREPKELFATARADYGREHPHVALTGSFALRIGTPMALALSDGIRTVHVSGEVPQTALKRPSTVEDTAERLKKTGGTPYEITELVGVVNPGLMAPAAQLNALRRDALEQMTALRGAPPQRRSAPYVTRADNAGANADKPVFTLYLRNAHQLTQALLERDPAVIYLPLEQALKAKRWFAPMLEWGVEPSVALPRVRWDRETADVEKKLAELKAAGAQSVLAGNLGDLELARRAGMRVRGDFGLEVYNAECARMYAGLGVESVTLSFEQRLSRVRDQKKPLPSELIVYGRLPLMITENCIYKARDGKCRRGCEAENSIVDRRKAKFPVLRAYGCRNEIFNSLPLWLADKQGELQKAGLWALRLNFTQESPEECLRVFDAYRAGNAVASEGFTRGLYYRDVE